MTSTIHPIRPLFPFPPFFWTYPPAPVSAPIFPCHPLGSRPPESTAVPLAGNGERAAAGSPSPALATGCWGCSRAEASPGCPVPDALGRTLEAGTSANLTLGPRRRCAQSDVRNSTRRGRGSNSEGTDRRPMATLTRLWRVTSRLQKIFLWVPYQRGQVTDRSSSQGSMQPGWNPWPQGSKRRLSPSQKPSVQTGQLCDRSIGSGPLLSRGARYLVMGSRPRASEVRHSVLSRGICLGRAEKNRPRPVLVRSRGVKNISMHTRMAKMMATLGGPSFLTGYCSALALANKVGGRSMPRERFVIRGSACAKGRKQKSVSKMRDLKSLIKKDGTGICGVLLAKVGCCLP
jgi:hypothetical protein